MTVQVKAIKKGCRHIPKKGVKTESAVTQLLLRETTKKKIAYLLSKHTIKDIEVYNLIKEFFKEYLKADYEFTFDELAQELKKTYIEKHIKETLFKLLEDFSTIEYKDEDLPDEMLKEFLGTFSKLIDELIKEEQKKGFFARLFGKKLPKKELRAKPVQDSKEKKPSVAKEELPKEKPDLQDIMPETLPEEQPKPLPSLPPTITQEHEQPQPAKEAPPSPSTTSDDQTLVPEDLAGTQGSDTPSQKEFTGWSEDAEPAHHDSKHDNDAPIFDEQQDEEDHAPINQEPAFQPVPASQEEPATPSQQAPAATQEPALSTEEQQLSQDLNVLAQELDDAMQEETTTALPSMDQTIKELIDETSTLIAKHQYERARQTYKELLSLYHELPEHEKHQFYQQVQTFYETLSQQA